MKSRLQSLLQHVILPDGRTVGAFAWDQIIVVENIGRIPAPVSIAGDFLWNRGFKALLVDRAGAPIYLCKCRGSGDLCLQRETEVRARLCTEDRLQRVIPWTSGTRDHEIQLQISRYIDGSLYQDLVPRLTLPKFVESIRSILEGAHLACDMYEDLAGGIVDSPLQPWEIAEPFVHDLAASGVSVTVLWTIEEFLRQAPPFQPKIQHGDLWPRNIIHDGQSWWLLDFEYVGETLVPLYDVYQLLRTCVLLRGRNSFGAGPTWFDCMSSNDPVARAAREVVRTTSSSLEINEDQAVGNLVCYLVEITGRLLRRRAPAVFCRSFVSELEQVGAALKAGTDLKTVFWRSTDEAAS